MREPFNILVAGVGGQGNLIFGRVLAEAAVRQGLRPVVGDTFGASRRGGSVLTHLRIGTIDWAPLIPKGEVDILVALEPMEALRAALEYAGERTVAVVSEGCVPTADVSSGANEYPPLQKLTERISELCKQVFMVDAESALARIGTHKVLNSLLLGAVSNLPQIPLNQALIKDSLQEIMDSDDRNITAFEIGTHILQTTR